MLPFMRYATFVHKVLRPESVKGHLLEHIFPELPNIHLSQGINSFSDFMDKGCSSMLSVCEPTFRRTNFQGKISRSRNQRAFSGCTCMWLKTEFTFVSAEVLFRHRKRFLTFGNTNSKFRVG
jgi:hypothetical protein